MHDEHFSLKIICGINPKCPIPINETISINEI